MSDVTLAKEAWRDDGHLSEAALHAIADGEVLLVPDDARAHLDGCDDCNARLGAAALASIDASVALEVAERFAAAAIEPSRSKAARSPATIAPSSKRRLKIPFFAIAAALSIAIVAAIPSGLALSHDTSAVQHRVSLVVHVFTALLSAAARGDLFGKSGAIISYSMAAVFLVVGVQIARRASRRRLLRQGDNGDAFLR